jgi:hypothetical protein
MPDINVSPLFQGNPSECVETFTYNASDLADKSFQMYGKNSAAGGTSMSVGNQVWTIREIQR